LPAAGVSPLPAPQLILAADGCRCLESLIDDEFGCGRFHADNVPATPVKGHEKVPAALCRTRMVPGKRIVDRRGRMLWWWWTTVLVLSSMLSASLGFFVGCMWQSSVGRWPDESKSDA